jgi:2-polyprenyl-6-methoxyphenol hydroxylase-like FAD-dependent oxidoreductase
LRIWRIARKGDPMAECFDVVVVGGRCAGSPLAALLARRGMRVAVVEQATFPRDTLSTHYFEARGLAFLNRLGVIEEIRATGAPFVGRNEVRLDDVEYVARIPQLPGDVGGGVSVRRTLLDPILAQAAAEAGAEMHMASKVTDLVRDGGRVRGVRVIHEGSETTLNARLVVGADGRNSTVANLVGSRKYNLVPNERFVYWCFFEGVDPGFDPAFIFHQWDEKLVLAFPTDSGLYQVILLPGLSELPRFRQDLEGSFMDYASGCEQVALALAGARRVGKFFGMLRWEGFFREPSGPGWVLVGDAGHFKDPTPGQGIQDAFGQVDSLAPAIATALDGSEQQQDRELAKWGRWRDQDATEHYWMAADMGKAGRLPAVQPEIVRRVLAQGKVDLLTNLFTHRSRPSQVFTPQRLLSATGRLLLTPGCDRRALLGEVAALVAEDRRRRRLNREPIYADASAAQDAGATEVDDATVLAA